MVCSSDLNPSSRAESSCVRRSAWLALGLSIALGASFVGCSSYQPSQLPSKSQYVIAVKALKLPDSAPAVTRFAEHTFFDLKRGSESRWERLEVINASQGVVHDPVSSSLARKDRRWRRDVSVLGVFEGCEAKLAMKTLMAEARAWEHDYAAWPGPNSNTFAGRLLRAADLWVELDHNAVGADYAPIAVQQTTAGLGVQLDTPILGLQLGLAEGVEVHLLQLTFGVAFWRPAIKLPFLPRLGPPLGPPDPEDDQPQDLSACPGD